LKTFRKRKHNIITGASAGGPSEIQMKASDLTCCTFSANEHDSCKLRIPVLQFAPFQDSSTPHLHHSLQSAIRGIREIRGKKSLCVIFAFLLSRRSQAKVDAVKNPSSTFS
jgi:hypothetical protein